MDRLRACNLRWLQRLIKEEWINLEHDINNTTLTGLLKAVLLSINSFSLSFSLCLPLGGRPSASSGKLTNTYCVCYYDSQSIKFRTEVHSPSTYSNRTFGLFSLWTSSAVSDVPGPAPTALIRVDPKKVSCPRTSSLLVSESWPSFGNVLLFCWHRPPSLTGAEIYQENIA